jgi:hypothetical protein
MVTKLAVVPKRVVAKERLVALKLAIAITKKAKLVAKKKDASLIAWMLSITPIKNKINQYIL